MKEILFLQKINTFGKLYHKVWISKNLNNIEKVFTITCVSNENGVILIEGILREETDSINFQVVNFSIAYKHNGAAYNIVIKV